jgi:hypothetical protein
MTQVPRALQAPKRTCTEKGASPHRKGAKFNGIAETKPAIAQEASLMNFTASPNV